MISADTNLFLYAANPQSSRHEAALGFFCKLQEHEFVLCGLVLVELWMQLRNPAVLKKPLSAGEATDWCQQLKKNPAWQFVDYEPRVGDALWTWARQAERVGFRRIIDARLGLTLRHHDVTEFATANGKDFQEFGFERVWDPSR